MEQLVSEIERSFAEVERQLGDPDVFNDPKRAAELGRRHKHLKQAFDLAVQWRQLHAQFEEAKELASDSEPEIREMAKAQRSEAETRLPQVETDLRLAMLEPHPSDGKDVLVEIRPGAGGDEASIWVGDLFSMFAKFSEKRGLSIEPIELASADHGGYSEAVFAVKGDDAFKSFRWESGVHRVQRVPATESQGRVHTSTATVVVRPEADPVDVQVEMSDLKIDVYRSSGPGGQSVNTTDSAVRITHMPTGLVVTCQNEKSQHQNRDQALRVLRSRLYEIEMQRQQDELSAQRKSAMGTGDRSEKIRTYNYGERRVTDHRIKLTLYKLDAVLAGDLDDFVDALTADSQRQELEAFAEASG